MRANTRIHSMLVVLCLALAALTACRRNNDNNDNNKAEESTTESISEKEGITKQHDGGTVVFSVTPDGKVKSLFKTPNGRPAIEGTTGTLTVKSLVPNAAPTTVPLSMDPKAGLLLANIPPLDADLTEVKYEINVGSKPVTGALYLPHGGTRALIESAKETANAKFPAGKKGPNGGIIQVVGDDVVEIVADKTGKLRVYVLDADGKPIKIGKRKITLAIVGPKGPETIVLTPGPGELYCMGKMSVAANPIEITVAVSLDDRTEVALCGYHPGDILVVGANAPTIAIVLVNVSWGVDVAVVNPSPVVVVNPSPVVVVAQPHWHGKGKGKGWGKHGKVKIKFH